MIHVQDTLWIDRRVVPTQSALEVVPAQRLEAKAEVNVAGILDSAGSDLRQFLLRLQLTTWHRLRRDIGIDSSHELRKRFVPGAKRIA